jgi:hypothetical protein
MLHLTFLSTLVVGQIQKYPTRPITALAVILLFVCAMNCWHRRRRTNAEYAAAIALTRASFTLRGALITCRSCLIATGETPPRSGGLLDSMLAAETTVREILPAIIGRYRAEGALTWASLHEMEAEVRVLLKTSGRYHPLVVDLICLPAEARYPKSAQPVSNEGFDLMPVSFQAIIHSWYQTKNVEDAPAQHQFTLNRAPGTITVPQPLSADVMSID